MSKKWLKGGAGLESLELRPSHFYTDNDIDLCLAQRVTSINLAARNTTLSTGKVIHYHHLGLALGARARKPQLPGVNLAGVLELRTATDADLLKAAHVVFNERTRGLKPRYVKRIGNAEGHLY